jgi:hypothetical protein
MNRVLRLGSICTNCMQFACLNMGRVNGVWCVSRLNWCTNQVQAVMRPMRFTHIGARVARMR